MNKTEFTARLHALNADLRAAIADGAFDKVRIIDERRQELLHQIAAEDAVEGDESLGMSGEFLDRGRREYQISGDAVLSLFPPCQRQV